MLFFNKKENNDEISFIVDNSYEIHILNNNIVILIVAFIHSPGLHCVIHLLEDKEDNTSELSPPYKKAIKKDIKKKKQYFEIDNIKYYLKHTII